MKKLYFLLLSILFLAACHEENNPVISENGSEGTRTKVLINRQVSGEQVKAFANQMANNIFSQEEGPKVKSATADRQRVIENITPIVTESNDTVMYSVNFKDNLGYLLIAADKGTFPILAFNDEGNFTPDRIDGNVGLEWWINAKSELLKERLHEPIDTFDNHYQLWEGFSISDDGEISIELVEYIPESEPLTRARRREPRNLPAISPSTGMLLKWGQGTGYNADAPNPNYAAGCPAVAVGMLCYNYWYPNKYNYLGMGAKFKEPTQKSNPVSKMLRDIADNIPGYKWGPISGAIDADVVIGLKNLGYKDAKLKTFDFDEVYRNLSLKRPVLLAGWDPRNGGHIWYCDGYKEMKWHVIKYKKRLFKKKKVGEWDEYADCLYMNWGWDGLGNGYYEDGDWKAEGCDFNTNRRMYTDLTPNK